MRKYCRIFVISLVIAAVLDIIPSKGVMAISSAPANVEIISPRKAEFVRGGLVFEVRIDNISEIDHLEYYIQEYGARDRYGWKQYEPPYRWGGRNGVLDTTLLKDGPASAVVFVFFKGNMQPKIERRVNFEIRNGKPFIRIALPNHGSTVNDEMNVVVESQDEVGIGSHPGIKSVSIFVDGKLLKIFSKVPYQFNVSTCLLGKGFHNLKVVAIDSENFTNSDELLFHVQ